jgi:A/G-specific adenine glycosylase
MLAKQGYNPNKHSAHYARKSAFEGSNRQIRGAILRALIQQGRLSEDEIKNSIADITDVSQPTYCNYERLKQVLDGLTRDHLIVTEDSGSYIIAP